MNSLSEQIQNVTNNTTRIKDLTTSTNQSIQTWLSSVEKLNESAGDAGRGFSVVAEQIKKLASQSITASTKINEII